MSASKQKLGPRNRRARARHRLAAGLEVLESRVVLSQGGSSLLPGTIVEAEHENVGYLPPTQYLRDLEGYLTQPSTDYAYDIALRFLRASASSLGVDASDIAQVDVSSQYTDQPSGTTHIYLVQMLNGLPVANAVAAAHVDALGRIINVSSNFIRKGDLQLAAPGLSALEGAAKAAANLGLKLAGAPTVVSSEGGAASKTTISAPGLSLDEVPAKLQYVATENGAELAWNYIIRTPDGDHWYDYSVDATSGDLIQRADWISHASYRVYQLPIESPLDGARTLAVNPHDPVASPFGWHDTDGQPGAEFTVTRGNNVSAQDDVDGNNTGGNQPDGGPSLVFDYAIPNRSAPSSYQDAAITNLFYMNNMLHDYHYHFGFTEAAGNFQVNNYGKGGQGGDAVQADAQDGSGIDNANFGTPPDGFAPRMQMFLWDLTNPNRDGDLDNGVIIHEYGHGVSNRLTGGPANASALFALQSGAMGEGWSDWWALMFTARPTDQFAAAYPIGNYVMGQPATAAGIRAYPYSYDMLTNPHTIADFNGGFPNNESHNAGEIWASALWDMSQLLVQKYGFSSNFTAGYTGPGSAGNLLALQLVSDALKLQPANPSFRDARDAIVQADKVLTGGANRREIWTAFGRRGMGMSFTTANSNSASVTQAFDTPNFVNPVGALTGEVGSTIDFSAIKVADFTVLPSDPPVQFTATINWGDNTTSAATITQNGSKYTFSGSHVYANFGKFNMSVQVSNGALWTDTVINPVTVLDAPITGVTKTQNVNEGIAVPGAVASFTSGNPLATPSQFTASIRWGDGSTSQGTVSANSDGGFDVTGSHTYRQGGNYEPTVTIQSKGGSKGVVKSKVIVADSPIDTVSVTANATESIVFLSPIARYTDHAPDGGLVSDWIAQVDWGDGTPRSDATIQGSNGSFAVLGDHVYTKYGTYTAKVYLKNSGGTATVEVDSTVTVADANLVGTSQVVAATVGTPFSGTLATYADANLSGQASDLVAKINWGDGVISDGVVTKVTAGNFAVSGTHVYKDTGSPTVTVELTSAGGAPIPVMTVPATVVDAPLKLNFAGVAVGPANNPSLSSPGLTVTLGDDFNGPLFTIRSTDPGASAGEYTVSVDWGDGSATTGTAVAGSADATGSNFTVNARHQYATAGSFPLKVSVVSKGGLVTRTTGAAHILLPLDGKIDPASDTGISNSDGVTNKSLLVYHGRSEFNAQILFYARPADGTGAPTLIGRTTADSLGNWTVATTTPLTDGRYIVGVDAADANGKVIQSKEFAGSTLTVDGSGPRVVSLKLVPAKGQAVIVYGDSGTGVQQGGLLNPASYSLSLPGKRGTSTFQTLSVVSAPQLAGPGQQAVIVSFKTKGRLVNGGYVVRIASSVVADVAGNALFERDFVKFPQLTNTPDNTFIGQIDVYNGVASPLKPYVPLPEIIAAQEYAGKIGKANGAVRIRSRRR